MAQDSEFELIHRRAANEAEGVAKWANDLNILTPEHARAAVELMETCAEMRKNREEFFTELIEEANSVHKKLTGWRKRVLEQYSEPEAVLKAKLLAWSEESGDRPEGLVFVDTWKHEVVSIVELIEAAHHGLCNIDFVQANDKALAQAAKSLCSMAEIPGVRVYCETSVRRKGKE